MLDIEPNRRARKVAPAGHYTIGEGAIMNPWTIVIGNPRESTRREITQ
jgi:hypothetical protein